jgi:hypothetical protein
METLSVYFARMGAAVPAPGLAAPETPVVVVVHLHSPLHPLLLLALQNNIGPPVLRIVHDPVLEQSQVEELVPLTPRIMVTVFPFTCAFVPEGTASLDVGAGVCAGASVQVANMAKQARSKYAPPQEATFPRITHLRDNYKSSIGRPIRTEASIYA